LNRIFSLIKKELLTAFKDKKIRLSLLVPPIIQFFVFTYAATLDVKNVPIGILNKDNGKKGVELIERFLGAKTFNKHMYFLQNEKEIAPFIDKQKGIMVLSINEHFSRDLEGGKVTELQLIFDGRKSNTAQIVAGYATEIIHTFNMEKINPSGGGLVNTAIIPRVWFNPNLHYYWYNIPCLVVILAMVLCLVITTQSIAREREMGTFDQLLVSPLLPFEILIGKIVPGIIVGLLEGLLMLLIGTFLLQVPFTGSFILYTISLFVFVSSISGVGLFISSLSATQQQAMFGTFFFMLPSVLLSGFATPIENMPSYFQIITYAIPLKYMLVISKGLFLKAMSAKMVFSQLWPLMVICVVNVSGATLFFRKRIQ
jgi:ABC-2 type transport system permease protein